MSDDSEEDNDSRDQGPAFECLAFAAGLKECVMLGWGDGRTERDGQVSQIWLDEVWGKVEKTFSLPGLAEDPDFKAVLDFMEGCKVHKMGTISSESAVQAGHKILYREPVSPALRLVLGVTVEEPVVVDETVLAYILDYPTPIPPYDDFNTRDHSTHSVSFLYRISTTGSWCGTEYFGARRPEIINKGIKHFIRYDNRLRGVVKIRLEIDEHDTFEGKGPKVEDVGKQSKVHHRQLIKLSNRMTSAKQE